MTKISSVKVEKDLFVKETFKKKGISELLSEVNFTIDVEDTNKNILKKFISAVKRKFKPVFLGLEKQKQLTYFDTHKIFDAYQVSITLLDEKMDKDQYHYIKRLVKACSNLRNTSTEVDVVEIKIVNGEEETVGYGLLNGEIKTSFHRTRRYFVGSKLKYGYKLMLDVPTLLAETIAVQSILKFSQANKDIIKYLYVKECLNPKNDVLEKPISELFLKDFSNIASTFHLNMEKAIGSEDVEKESNIFYGDVKREIGTKHHILVDRLLLLVIKEFIEQSSYSKFKANQFFNERSEYAKSFQTKKQIKQTHLNRMGHNAFLSNYGYVELDNEVGAKRS